MNLLHLLALLPLALCLNIWPSPRNYTTGTIPLRLSPSFAIHVDPGSNSKSQAAPSDLQSAISRTLNLLKTDNLQRLVPGRGVSDVSSSAFGRSAHLTSLTLSLSTGKELSAIASEAQKPIEDRDESYALSVPSDGSAAVLRANTSLGLLRGLTTFTQIWYTVDNTTYLLSAPVEISDTPAYAYRGFMLDTARNFFPVSDILRTLDAMSWVKINTLHWHITDSQSFPLVVPSHPELSQAGAYSTSKTYSPEDVQNIVTYAGERGIDVLMEIDTPGHTGAIAPSHPDLVACNVASPWSDFANEPPAGQLLITPTGASFAATLLQNIAKVLPSTLFSTGGDEVNTNCYMQDQQFQEVMNSTGKSLETLLDEFVMMTHQSLRDIGKTPVVWEEMVLEHNITLSNDTVVMVWISSQDAAAVAAKNFRLVHSPSDYFYLDCGAGEWIGNDIDGNSWCDPFKTWQRAYSFDPLANLTTEQFKLVLGGQQLLWTEQSSPNNLDPIVWPRAATSAEIFWTGATLSSGAPRNVTEALPRLHELRYRMVNRGVNAIPLQPEWCALRPNQCGLFS